MKCRLFPTKHQQRLLDDTLDTCRQVGLDHGIGHFMLVEVASEAQAAVPPIPKSRQTSTAASDRKTSRQLSSR
jgi:hypothetical protein